MVNDKWLIGMVNRLVHGSFCYVLTINHLSLIIAAFGR